MLVEDTENSRRKRAYYSYSALTYNRLVIIPPDIVTRATLLASVNPSLLNLSYAKEINTVDPYSMQFNFPSSDYCAARVPFSGLYVIAVGITTNFAYEFSRLPKGLLKLEIRKRSQTDIGYGTQSVNQGTVLSTTPLSSFISPEDGFGAWTTIAPAFNGLTTTVELNAGDEVYPELYFERYSAFSVEAICRNLSFSVTEVSPYTDRYTT